MLRRSACSALRCHTTAAPSSSSAEPLLHIVLVEPQIPPNTGTIGRLALATRCRLHLVGKLGFSLDEKALQRAGMDYWRNVDCVIHATWAEYLEAAAAPNGGAWLFTTHATRPHWGAAFRRGDHLLFGNEGAGAPEAVHRWVTERHGEAQRLRLPMSPEVEGRSLNLACTVSCGVYEALRQIESTGSTGLC